MVRTSCTAIFLSFCLSTFICLTLHSSQISLDERLCLNEGDTPHRFHDLGEGSSFEELEEHLRAGADWIDRSDDGGNTLLYRAVYNGDIHLMKLLLAYHTSVHALNGERVKETALHQAVRSGCVECMETLVKAGADENAQMAKSQTDKLGDTPLHVAITHDRWEAFQALLKTKVNTGIQNFEGRTPLHTAAEKGSLKYVKALLAAEVDTEVYDDYGLTPLFFAIQKYRKEYGKNPMSLAVERADADKDDSEEGSTFQEKDDSLKIIQALLRYKDTTRFFEGCGFTAPWMMLHKKVIELVKALEIKDVALIQLLFTPNESPDDYYDVQDCQKVALHLAVLCESAECIPVLVDRGARLNEKALKSESAFHWAVRLNNPELIKALHKIGANKELDNRDGETPLFLAVKIGAWESFIALLELGANLNPRDIASRTPLLEAVQKEGFLDYARKLVEAGADTKVVDLSGLTPLHHAVKRLDDALVKILLKEGANPNAVVVATGMTPLHIAALRSDGYECACTLLAAGASLDSVENTKGYTALQIAVDGDSLKHIRLFLGAGASVAVQDKVGQTVLEETFLKSHSNSCCYWLIRTLIEFSYLWFLDEPGLEASRKRVGEALRVLTRSGLSIYMQIQVLLSQENVSDDVVKILLHELKEGNPHSSKLFANAKDAATIYLLKRLRKLFEERLSKIYIQDPKLASILDDESTLQDIRKGLDNRFAQLKIKHLQMKQPADSMPKMVVISGQ